ncbi:putative N-acetyltransferase YafP [Allorhodopirellula heiligendammensis]|uniref:N-acetyltransferase YafP n=2 Tax=Allorhodopirellula heiligendammensis TaxID=2714739 RepID=A0A5C6BH00_9BACT|nr:putative N-acetyltransferase YafP [Allorhodopirellula heiligendammensis]
MWAKRFEGRFACVACDGKMIVGFTDITRDGHLDRLFVSADHQRQGIARGLIERLTQHAEQQGFEFVTTEASVTAKTFFEAMLFVVIKRKRSAELFAG